MNMKKWSGVERKLIQAITSQESEKVYHPIAGAVVTTTNSVLKI